MEDISKLTKGLNICDYYHIIERNRTINCIVKKDCCNVKSTIWRLNFPRDVKFEFEDYCGSSFNEI